jgi:hypothetical protein
MEQMIVETDLMKGKMFVYRNAQQIFSNVLRVSASLKNSSVILTSTAKILLMNTLNVVSISIHFKFNHYLIIL